MSYPGMARPSITIEEVTEEQENDPGAIDLSANGIFRLPDLNAYANTESLHLSNNRLESLPEEIFVTLSKLKWLDVRENRLSSLPSSVAGHEHLRSLLLANNRFTRLPLELGKVQTLKYLQLKGNPLEYPDGAVIRSGTAEILKFLNAELEKLEEKTRQQAVEEQVNAFENEKGDGREKVIINSVPEMVEMERRESGNKDRYKLEDPREESLEAALIVELYEKDFQTRVPYAQISNTVLPTCPRLNAARFSSSQHSGSYNSKRYVRPSPAPSREELLSKIKRNKVNESSKERHKQLLALRAKILQDVKTIDELRNWRVQYKRDKMNRRTHELPRTAPPFDIDPECDKMMNRKDLYADLPDKYKKNLNTKTRAMCRGRHSNQNKQRDVAAEITEIFNAIEGPGWEEKPPCSPSTEQRIITREIIKLTNIMKKLDSLRFDNDATV